MRKSLLSLVAVALMMSACTQDVAESNGGSIDTFIGNVGVNAATVTRTAMAENENGGLNITWVEGDAIGLSAEDANATIGTNVKYTANSSNTTSTTFTCAGKSIKWGVGNHKFYAYYPYTAKGNDYTAVPATVPAVQTQSVAGNTDHMQQYAFMYAPLATEGVPADGNIALQFRNAFSILELSVYAEAEDINCESLIFRANNANEAVSAEGVMVDLTDGSLDYTTAKTTNQIQLNLGENVTLSQTTAQKFYLLITPGHGGQTFSFYAVVDGEEVLLGSQGIPAEGIPAGCKAVLALNIPAPAQDNTIDLSANGTANCYVVNTAGAKYKFKANVKGNGYDPLTGTTAEAEAIDLTNANAYILWGYKRTTSDGADNTGLNASILRESVKIDGDYITFETPADMLDGNVGIAVADANGNIMWSWHMWCVQGYDYQASAVDVAVHGMNYKIMDRNMGAFSNPAAIENPTEEDFAYAHGLYYQWGRKDPFFCGGTQYSSGTWFDFIKNGVLVKSPTFSIKGQTAFNYNDFIKGHGMSDFAEILAHSIQNPLQFYLSSNNWVSASDNDNSNGQEAEWGKLWGNQKNNYTAAVKTMYDPCPVGYNVAAPEHFKFVTATGKDITSSYPTWQLNATTNIVDDSDTNPLKSSPWGLFFYTKGLRTEDGAHPADKTTVFLPKERWIQNTGSINDKNYICMYTNAPTTEASRGGKAYKMKVEYKGYVSLAIPSWTNASQSASAFAIRCVSENK